MPIKKEIKKDSSQSENKAIIYKIKFIDSSVFMSPSLSKLTDNLSNRIIENGKCEKKVVALI